MSVPLHAAKQNQPVTVRQPSIPDSPVSDLSPAELQNAPGVLKQALHLPQTLSSHQVLTLQRLTGNYATTRLVQPQLMVGPAGDRYEQEADQIAERVMSGPPVAAPPVRRQDEELQTSAISGPSLAASITPLIRRQEEEDVQTAPLQRQEEEEVQTALAVRRQSSGNSGFAAGTAFENKLSQVQGGGKSLPESVRSEFEPRFGADFSGVRVHTGGESADLNQAIQARAFTHGQDIYMGEGQYDPGSTAGKRLLAHELTHTIQQTGAPGVAQRDGTQREGREFTVGWKKIEEEDEEEDQEEDQDQKTERQVKGGTSGWKEQTSQTETTEQMVGGGTVKTEKTGSQMHGTQALIEHIVTVKDDTIEEAVQVLALAGAFGEASARKVLQKGSLQLSAEGSAKGEAVSQAYGKVGQQTTKANIELGGHVLGVIQGIKYLAQAGVDVHAGGELAGKLTAQYGPVGAELAGKLQAFVRAAADFGGSFEFERIGPIITKIEAALMGQAKIGVEASAEGSFTVKFGEVVALKASGKAEGFAGAQASFKGGARFSLSDFFKLGFGAERKENEETGDIEEKDAFAMNYGLALWGKAQAEAGAKGSLTGAISMKVKDVEADITAKVEGLAGADASAEAKFGISLTGIVASAKAEAFAGAKAEGTLSGSIKYKGKAIFKISGKAGVSAGVGGEIGGEFEFGAGKLKIGGALAGALGIGGEIELNIEIDFALLAQAIFDLIAAKYAQYLRDKQARQKRAILFAEDVTGVSQAPGGVGEAEIKDQVKAVVQEPLRLYAEKKATQGKHWIKKENIQQIIDEQVVLNPALEVLLASPHADRALEEAVQTIFGIPVDAIKFRQGTISQFGITEDLANEKKVKGVLRQPFLEYAQKKATKGTQGAKATKIEAIINKNLPTELMQPAAEPWIKDAIIEAFAGNDPSAVQDLQVRVVSTTGTFGRTNTSVTVPKFDLKPAGVETVQKQAVESAVLQPIKDYIAKKSSKGANWVKKEEIESLVNKHLPSKYMGSANVTTWLAEAVTKAFGQDSTHANRLAQVVFQKKTVTGMLGSQSDQIEATTFTLKDEATQLKAVAKDKVKAALLKPFQEYAQKKTAKGKDWIKKERVEALINSNIPQELLVDEANAIVGVKEAAQEAFGDFQEFEVSFTTITRMIGKDYKQATLTKFTPKDDKVKQVAQAKIEAAILQPLTTYVQKKKERGNEWVKKPQIEEVLNKNLGQEYMANATNVQAAVTSAGKKAFGKDSAQQDILEQITVQIDTVPGLISSSKKITVTALQIKDEAQARKAVTQDKIKAAVLEPFKAYALKKAKKGTSWVKQERVQELIRSNLSTEQLNVEEAVLKAGLADAAKEAFGELENFEIKITHPTGFFGGTSTVFELTQFKIKDTALVEAKKAVIVTALQEPLTEYAKEKAVKGLHGIKKERVEEIMNKNLPTKYLQSTTASAAQVQDWVKEAIIGIFGVKTIKDLNVQVQDVTKWARAKKIVSITAFALQENEIKRQVIQKVMPAFEVYARKSKGGVTLQGIQQVINQNVASDYLQTAEADDGITQAAKLIFGGRITITVQQGKVINFTP